MYDLTLVKKNYKKIIILINKKKYSHEKCKTSSSLAYVNPKRVLPTPAQQGQCAGGLVEFSWVW